MKLSTLFAGLALVNLSGCGFIPVDVAKINSLKNGSSGTGGSGSTSGGGGSGGTSSSSGSNTSGGTSSNAGSSTTGGSGTGSGSGSGTGSGTGAGTGTGSADDSGGGFDHATNLPGGDAYWITAAVETPLATAPSVNRPGLFLGGTDGLGMPFSHNADGLKLLRYGGTISNFVGSAYSHAARVSSSVHPFITFPKAVVAEEQAPPITFGYSTVDPQSANGLNLGFLPVMLMPDVAATTAADRVTVAERGNSGEKQDLAIPPNAQGQSLSHVSQTFQNGQVINSQVKLTTYRDTALTIASTRTLYSLNAPQGSLGTLDTSVVYRGPSRINVGYSASTLNPQGGFADGNRLVVQLEIPTSGLISAPQIDLTTAYARMPGETFAEVTNALQNLIGNCYRVEDLSMAIARPAGGSAVRVAVTYTCRKKSVSLSFPGESLSRNLVVFSYQIAGTVSQLISTRHYYLSQPCFTGEVRQNNPTSRSI